MNEGKIEKLKGKFFERETLTVARELLGCFLVREIGGEVIRARIVETEAYVGEDDLACHASKGRTGRTEVMYGAAGHAYVYLVYGMYEMFNIVTEKEDFPAAVLVRSVEIEGISKIKTNGPGKLTRILKINRNLNQWDLTRGEALWIEFGQLFKGEEVVTSKRIGIDYAKHCSEYPWRFLLLQNKAL